MSMRQRMIRRRLLAALAFAAVVVPPAAQARPDFYSVPTSTPTQAVVPPSAPAVKPVASASQDGFQWSDAGIGAGWRRAAAGCRGRDLGDLATATQAHGGTRLKLGGYAGLRGAGPAAAVWDKTLTMSAFYPKSGRLTAQCVTCSARFGSFQPGRGKWQVYPLG